MLLKDKTAIITGGSTGIGRAIAIAFAAEGAHLVLNARSRNELLAARDHILGIHPARVEIFPGDVSLPENVSDLKDFTLHKFGTIDILVNCAGIYGPIGPLAQIDYKEWMAAVNINLGGTFLCMQAVLPVMLKNNKGKIINMSGGGAASPYPRFSSYACSKAAVVRLTENTAQELKGSHIDINAIAPGAVNTRFLDQVLASAEAAGPENLAKALKQKQEGGVPPEKVAALAVFLASALSDGISGKMISLLWDNWQDFPQHRDELMSSDVYTLRRIVPKDRGYEW